GKGKEERSSRDKTREGRTLVSRQDKGRKNARLATRQGKEERSSRDKTREGRTLVSRQDKGRGKSMRVGVWDDRAGQC
ncbi:hypothetical protein BaRGS_00036218, partial [Batillaria attramentaria]